MPRGAAAGAQLQRHRLQIDAQPEIAAEGRALIDQIAAHAAEREDAEGARALGRALAHHARVVHATHVARNHRGVTAARDVEGALAQVFAIAFGDEVAARLDGQARAGAIGRHLGDHRAITGVVLHQERPRVGEDQRAAPLARQARLGQRQVVAARHLQPVGRMLRAGQRQHRRGQRSIGGVGERFGDGDPPVAIAIRRAQQRRHQVVGEDRCAQLVRLLRVLARGAGGQDRQAARRRRRLDGDVEVGHRARALHARERARTARIDDQHARLGGRGGGEVAQLRQLEPGSAEVQRLPVGVARVEDPQHLHAGDAAQARVQADQRAPHILRAGAGQAR